MDSERIIRKAKLMQDKALIEREINRKRNMQSQIPFGYDVDKLESYKFFFKYNLLGKNKDITREKYIKEGINSLVSTMKLKNENLRRMNSGPIKENLLKQVMGNQRGSQMQSEYSGQYNLSSSLYFQIMDEVLRGKLNENNAIKEQNMYQSVKIKEKQNDNQNHFGIMSIYRGSDQIPGKTFTQSQHYFRNNQVNRK